VPDPALTSTIFERLRPAPGGGRGYPAACGRFAVAHVRDLTLGFDSSTPDKCTTLPASAASQHLTFTFANGSSPPRPLPPPLPVLTGHAASLSPY
jgi:glucose-1,6-bisphosphate synthase